MKFLLPLLLSPLVAQAAWVDGFAPFLKSDRLRDEVEIIAFYYSALWCGPCRQTTPHVVDFYNQMHAANPRFEIIFISHDQDVNTMSEYRRRYGMTFPAIRYDALSRLPREILQPPGSGIPQLVLYRRSGERLSHHVGTRPVLQAMNSLLQATGDDRSFQKEPGFWEQNRRTLFVIFSLALVWFLLKKFSR
ncbi:MAG: thioredoxin-like domain-containing protein [Verrucomicrobiota bacterium]